MKILPKILVLLVIFVVTQAQTTLMVIGLRAFEWRIALLIICFGCARVERHSPLESSGKDNAALHDTTNTLEGKTQDELAEILFSRPSADQFLTNFFEQVKANMTANQLQEWALKALEKHRPDNNIISTNIPMVSENWPVFLRQLNRQTKIAAVSARYGDENLLPHHYCPV